MVQQVAPRSNTGVGETPPSLTPAPQIHQKIEYPLSDFAYAGASSPLPVVVSFARRSVPRLKIAFRRASARAAADMVVEEEEAACPLFSLGGHTKQPPLDSRFFGALDICNTPPVVRGYYTSVRPRETSGARLCRKTRRSDHQQLPATWKKSNFRFRSFVKTRDAVFLDD
jgi:hypothetical protein